LLVGGNNGSGTLSAVYLFDPAQSAFSTLASMPAAREGHTATVLANGNILVAGGKNGTTTLATAALFNPSSGPGTWTTTGSMTSPRQGHTATLIASTIVANGQVLVAGGSNGTSTLGSAELFNGVSTWTSTSALVAPCQNHTATALPNGGILVAGGLNGTTTLNSAQIYDASLGLACMSNSQCTTGACISGVCCDSPCNNGCGSCTLAGKVGICSPITAGTSCRASAGACDVAETCTGASTSCPADALVPAGSICRPAVDLCDSAETCTGQSPACPSDALQPAGTTCRAATGQCDLAEVCSGSSTACPADSKAANGTSCNDQNQCTQTDSCQAGSCVGANPVVCSAIDQCHTPGSCSPATGACTNPAKPDGTGCDDQNACTLTDTCAGGSCVGANTPTCDDGNSCTQDACDPAVGCTNVAIPCNVRSGRIEAESYDAQNGVTTSATSVTPVVGSAWIQFNSVDFGPAGTTGRFQVGLLSAGGNHHLELRLDSQSGTLVADLNTLPADATGSSVQSVAFQPGLSLSGIKTVVVVFVDSDVGSLDWFSLEKGRAKDTIADFPPSFRHSNPGQVPPDLSDPPVVRTDSDGDVPKVKWFSPKLPWVLNPGQTRGIELTVSEPLGIIAQASWPGQVGDVTLRIFDSQKNILATGSPSSTGNGGRTQAVTLVSSPQRIAVRLTNSGAASLSVQFNAGAIKGEQ